MTSLRLRPLVAGIVGAAVVLLAAIAPASMHDDNDLRRCSGYPNGLTGKNGWRTLQEPCVPRDTPPARLEVVDAFGRKGVQKVFLPDGAALCGQIKRDAVTGERIEVMDMKDRRGDVIGNFDEGDVTFMAFSLYLPKNAGERYVQANVRATFLQLHPRGRGMSPAWAFRDAGGVYAMVSGRQGKRQRLHILDDPKLVYNAWTDFVVRTAFGVGTGEYTVWRRDADEDAFRQVLDVSGITNLRTPGTNYLKSGIYRDVDTNGTSTHFMATPSVATTFEAAVAGLFDGCP